MKNLQTFENFISDKVNEATEEYVVFLDLKENGKGKQEMFRGPKVKAERVADNIWGQHRDGGSFEIGVVTADEWKEISKK